MDNKRGVVKSFKTDVDELRADKLWQISGKCCDKDVKYEENFELDNIIEIPSPSYISVQEQSFYLQYRGLFVIYLSFVFLDSALQPKNS
jgi:hypothetical protein